MSEKRCPCVSVHRPRPKVLNKHHIVPKSWGGGDEASNIIVICPNAHENIHRLLNHYVRGGGVVTPQQLRPFSRFERRIALAGWNGRPTGVERLPYTSGHGLR